MDQLICDKEAEGYQNNLFSTQELCEASGIPLSIINEGTKKLFKKIFIQPYIFIKIFT